MAKPKQTVLAIRFTDDAALRKFLDSAVELDLIPRHVDLRAVQAMSLDGLGSVRNGVYLLTTDTDRPEDRDSAVWLCEKPRLPNSGLLL